MTRFKWCENFRGKNVTVYGKARGRALRYYDNEGVLKRIKKKETPRTER